MDLLGGYGSDSDDNTNSNSIIPIQQNINNNINKNESYNQNNNLTNILLNTKTINNNDLDESSSTSLFSNLPKFIKKSNISSSLLPKSKKIKKSKLIDINKIKEEDPDLFIKKDETKDSKESEQKEEISSNTASSLSWLPAPKTYIPKKVHSIQEPLQPQHNQPQQLQPLPQQPQVEQPVIYYSDASIYNLADMDDNQIAALQQAQSQSSYNPYNRPEWEIPSSADVSNLADASIEDPVAAKFLNEYNKSNNNKRIYSISHSDVFNKVKAEAAMPQPTCTNKRRHHISELVEHATILHDEILIKSAHRQNSKRAAAQRYGW